jgi:hypothetical protein
MLPAPKQALDGLEPRLHFFVEGEIRAADPAKPNDRNVTIQVENLVKRGAAPNAQDAKLKVFVTIFGRTSIVAGGTGSLILAKPDPRKPLVPEMTLEQFKKNDNNKVRIETPGNYVLHIKVWHMDSKPGKDAPHVVHYTVPIRVKP